MIKLDNSQIEEKIILLFIQLNDVNTHLFFNNLKRKTYLMADLYIYMYFFIKNINSDNTIILHLIDNTLNNFKIKNNMNVDYIQNFLSILVEKTEPARQITSHDEIKMYNAMSLSIIRKMKISLI